MNIDLDKLEQVARAATPGPWASVHHAVVEANGGHLICPVSNTRGKYEYERGNRDYIAAANPAVVLELVRRLRAAEADAARWAWLREMHDGGDEQWFVYGAKGKLDADADAMMAIAAQGASHD